MSCVCDNKCFADQLTFFCLVCLGLNTPLPAPRISSDISPALSHTTCHERIRRSGVTPPSIAESLLYVGKYCSQIHAPIALPQRKNPPVPIGWVLGWGVLMNWSAGSGEERNLVPFPMIEAVGPGHIVCAAH